MSTCERYPPYQRFIPSRQTSHLTVSRLILKAVLEGLALLSCDRTHRMLLALEPGGFLRVAWRRPTSGPSRIASPPYHDSHDTYQIAFNSDLLRR